jgi:hypothetical protein
MKIYRDDRLLKINEANWDRIARLVLGVALFFLVLSEVGGAGGVQCHVYRLPDLPGAVEIFLLDKSTLSVSFVNFSARGQISMLYNGANACPFPRLAAFRR